MRRGCEVGRIKMAKPYLTEDELKDFSERLKATVELGNKHGGKLTTATYIPSFSPLDVIVALYSERLDRTSRRLNRLTWALIVLTAVLTVLTGLLVWGVGR